MNIKLFIIIYLIQISFAIQDYNNTCQNKNLYKFIILILHHILDVYLFFSVFFNQNNNEKYFHIIILFTLLFYWYFNDNKCDLTIYLNKLCKLEDEQRGLYSLVHLLQKSTKIYYLHSYLLITILSYYFFTLYPHPLNILLLK